MMALLIKFKPNQGFDFVLQNIQMCMVNNTWPLTRCKAAWSTFFSPYFFIVVAEKLVFCHSAERKYKGELSCLWEEGSNTIDYDVGQFRQAQTQLKYNLSCWIFLGIFEVSR